MKEKKQINITVMKWKNLWIVTSKKKSNDFRSHVTGMERESYQKVQWTWIKIFSNICISEMILIEHAYTWRSNSKITVSSIRSESHTIECFFFFQKKHTSNERPQLRELVTQQDRKNQNRAKQMCHVDYDRHHQIESTCLEQETYVNSCLHYWRYLWIDFLYPMCMILGWRNEFWWYEIQKMNSKVI